MATKFQAEKIDFNNINNGNEFENGDGIDASAINAPIKASAYAQEVAEETKLGLDNKVDKAIGKDTNEQGIYVYGYKRSATGNPSEQRVKTTSNPTAAAIVNFDANGCLRSNEPTYDNQVVPLGYFNANKGGNLFVHHLCIKGTSTTSGYYFEAFAEIISNMSEPFNLSLLKSYMATIQIGSNSQNGINAFGSLNTPQTTAIVYRLFLVNDDLWCKLFNGTGFSTNSLDSFNIEVLDYVEIL